MSQASSTKLRAAAGKFVSADTRPSSADTHPGPGCRIRLDFKRPDPRIAQQLAEFETPDISDRLNRLYAPEPEIRCLTGENHKLAGTVCTVKVYPGDNLMVHKALDIAQPGDVIVIDAGRNNSTAVLGDLISMKARHRRIAGVIVDGYIRDLPNIRLLDFPVFARGTTPVGPLHRGPGEINYQICCGGVVVSPGDFVVADQAGVVVVPQDFAAKLYRQLVSKREESREYLAAVRQGTFSNEWVDKVLAETGCALVEK